jgi:hypothetical protein
MTANIMLDKMFYGLREPAWHKLGYISQVEQTAQEAMSNLGGGYFVEKRPVFVYLNGGNQDIGDYALVRSAIPDDPKEYIFGIVSKEYNVLNPLDIAILFDENVKAPVETLGFLGNGQKMFLTWTLPSSFIGDKKDEVRNHGFIACGYDGRFGANLYLTTTKVVCENTFTVAVQVAQSSNNETDRRVWTGRHNSTNLARDLGAWLAHVQGKAFQKLSETEAVFNKMASFEFNDEEEVDDLLNVIYPDPSPISVDMPSVIKNEKEERRESLLEKALRDRQLVKLIFDEKGTAIDATAWGLFNSVTEYENWGRATRKPAEYSIMLGGRGQTMNTAYKVIADYMKDNK